MKWYKIWRGLPFDARLGVVAKKAGLSRAESIALYIAVLDTAAASAPPGCIAALDAEELSISLGIEPARITAGLQALRDRKMICGARVTCWAQKPSSSTLRVRAWRKKQKQMEAGARKNPPPAAPSHPDSPAAISARRERLLQDNPARRPQP